MTTTAADDQQQNNGNGNSGVDRPRSDDDSKFHIWEIDTKGGQSRLSEESDNIYDNIMEIIQNAIDSGLDVDNWLDKQATVKVQLPDYPNPHNRVITVEDDGLGITKNYDGDIVKFTTARKAVSNKVRGKGVGNKGIGMLQYIKVGKNIIIISQDQYFVYRIPILIKDGMIGYGSWEKWPIQSLNEEYRKHELRLTHQGTKITFYDKPDNIGKIDQQKLIDRTKKYFGLIIKRSPKVSVDINGIRVTPPEYLLKEPEIELFKLDQTLPEPISVTGAIWPDKNGIGLIKVHVDGAYVEDFRFDRKRRCSGWIAIDGGILDVNSSRDKVSKYGNVWKELCDKMVNIWMKKFELIQEEGIDPKEIEDKKKKCDILTKILSRFIPKIPGIPIQNNMLRKQEMPGNAYPEQGEDTKTGYRKAKEPDPFRVIVPRGPYRPRKNKSPKQVGIYGTDTVIAEDPNQVKRKEETNIDIQFSKVSLTADLLTLYKDRLPYVLDINMLYPLYDQVWKTNNMIEFTFRIAPYLAPIYAELNIAEKDLQELRWTKAIELVQNTILDIFSEAGVIKIDRATATTTAGTV